MDTIKNTESINQALIDRIAALEAQLAETQASLAAREELVCERTKQLDALEKRCAQLEALSGQYKYFTSFTPCFPLNDWFAERDKLHVMEPNTALASLLKPTCELWDRVENFLAQHGATILRVEVRQERQRLEGICKP